MFTLILVMMGQQLKKWQQFFEIKTCGGRLFELWSVRLFDVTDEFLIK